AKVVAKLSGKTIEVELKPGQTILDGLLENGASPPYSCLAGACSTCMAKVSKGGVKMEVCFAIDDDEIAQGYILACQSRPTTPEVHVDFDV
ncbi:MAG: 2Fe-2S iron-sulfur cluster binding domain-containing protein, partial [Bacteroidota bacterium]